MCDPKTYYDCGVKTAARYVRDNEAANCRCPRQCRRLSYKYSISQAKLSYYIVAFAKAVFRLNETIDEISRDHCSLEVNNIIKATPTIVGEAFIFYL